MNYSEYLPYAVAFIIAVPFLVYIRQFVSSYIILKEKELQMLGIKFGAENRLQAYEKLTIFLERLKPATLVSRFDKGLKPHEFLFLTEKSISEEFEYNAAQQLYLSKNLWQEIAFCKDEILRQAHKVYESLNEGASLDDFKTVFLMNYVNGEDFIGNTLDSLKREALLFNSNK